MLSNDDDEPQMKPLGGVKHFLNRKNSKKPAQWLALAEQGDAEAQCEMGQRFLDGDRYDAIPMQDREGKNPTQAVFWLEKASEQKFSAAEPLLLEAWTDLGRYYREGREEYNVEQDFGEAVRYFKQAAEKDDANALYHLGKCYYTGEGVTCVAPDQAIHCFERAIVQRTRKNKDVSSEKEMLVKAQYLFGESYLEGKHGNPVDPKKAIEQFRKVAGSKEPGIKKYVSWAQYEIGISCLEGRGSKKNYKKAVYWLSESFNNGYTGAKEKLTVAIREEEKAVKALELLKTSATPAADIKTTDTKIVDTKITDTKTADTKTAAATPQPSVKLSLPQPPRKSKEEKAAAHLARQEAAKIIADVNAKDKKALDDAIKKEEEAKKKRIKDEEDAREAKRDRERKKREEEKKSALQERSGLSTTTSAISAVVESSTTKESDAPKETIEAEKKPTTPEVVSTDTTASTVILQNIQTTLTTTTVKQTSPVLGSASISSKSNILESIFTVTQSVQVTEQIQFTHLNSGSLTKQACLDLLDNYLNEIVGAQQKTDNETIQAIARIFSLLKALHQSTGHNQNPTESQEFKMWAPVATFAITIPNLEKYLTQLIKSSAPYWAAERKYEIAMHGDGIIINLPGCPEVQNRRTCLDKSIAALVGATKDKQTVMAASASVTTNSSMLVASPSSKIAPPTFVS